MSRARAVAPEHTPVAVRRIVRELHIYLGLFCSAYVVLFGLSSLSMNHPGSVFDSEPVIRDWIVQVPPGAPAADAKLAVARYVTGAAGLKGYIPDYLLRYDEAERLKIQVNVPGRRYDVLYDRTAGTARVEETDKGLWGVLRSLHGRAGNASIRAWAIVWRLYTEITIGALGFAVLSGVYIWWPRLRDRRRGLWMTAGGMFACVGLMLWIWI